MKNKIVVKTEDSEKTEEGKACEITLRRTCKAYVAQRAEA